MTIKEHTAGVTVGERGPRNARDLNARQRPRLWQRGAIQSDGAEAEKVLPEGRDRTRVAAPDFEHISAFDFSGLVQSEIDA